MFWVYVTLNQFLVYAKKNHLHILTNIKTQLNIDLLHHIQVYPKHNEYLIEYFQHFFVIIRGVRVPFPRNGELAWISRP